MLNKTLTAKIKLELNFSKYNWPVFIDKNDIEDALLNLSINAMHAMPEGGSMTISTENVTLAEPKAAALNISAGDYVRLNINDTGIGMDDETIAHIFDPFFSTKETGKGTGLGLSQVYGFVKRCKGAITVESKINAGTMFSLYFPRYLEIDSDDKDSKTDDSSNITKNLQGCEKVLIVDDEAALRELVKVVLTQKGYNVITAKDGQNALDILEKNNSIELVLSDIIMPELDGYQLAKIVRKAYPDIKIQLMSGYSQTKTSTEGIKDLSENILSKPFTDTELLKTVRTTLDH